MEKISKSPQSTGMSCLHGVIATGLLALAFVIRFPIGQRLIFYTADVSIVELMALHFLKGQFSFYYWGQGYYGALDSVILMPLYAFFGSAPQVSQMMILAMTLLLLCLYHRYLARISDPWKAHITIGLLAVSSPYFLYVSFGCYLYIFVLILGFLHLFTIQWIEKRRTATIPYLVLGLLAGFSWYYFRLIFFFWIAMVFAWWVPERSKSDLSSIRKASARILDWGKWYRMLSVEDFSLPKYLKNILRVVNVANVLNALVALGLWLHGDWKISIGPIHTELLFWPTLKISLKVLAVELVLLYWPTVKATLKTLWGRQTLRALTWGFLVGYSPALLGSLMGSSPSSPGKLVPLAMIVRNIRMFTFEMLPYMFGLPDAGWQRGVVLGTMLLGVGYIVWRIIQAFRQHSPRASYYELALYGLFFANLITGWFCGDLGDKWNARYFLPFYICIPFGISCALFSLPRLLRPLAWLGVGICLLTWHAGIDRLMHGTPAVDPFVTLAGQLEAEGVKGGFADYWVAYRLTAMSKEKLIISPIGDNVRYQPYQTYVQSLSQIVLLGEPNAALHAILTVKGNRYKVIRQEVIAGIQADYLERIS